MGWLRLMAPVLDGGGDQLQTDKLLQETGADRVTCQVLHHDVEQGHRLVVLGTLTGDSVKPQSVAYTLLAPAAWPAKLHMIDSLLHEGNLMGQTFRHNGYTVHQNRLFRVRLPIFSKHIATLYGCSRWRLTEVECYEFWADTVLYGTVLEIKAPQRKLAPARRKLGTYPALRSMGITDSTFYNWLSKKTIVRTRHWPHVAYARMWGFLLSARLYCHAVRMYSAKLAKDVRHKGLS